MSSDFEVRGAEDFYRLSKALKHSGRTELRKELNKGLKKAAVPLIKNARVEAIQRLPARGGLNRLVAKTPTRVQVRTGADSAGVRIVVVKSNSGARRANRGVLRHPVFADSSQDRSDWTWVDQPVEPGWFDDPMREGAPVVRGELEQSMETVARKIIEEAR